MKRILCYLLLGVIFFGCKKDKEVVHNHNVIFKFQFNPNQERLDNFGNPSTMPAGNAGQSPQFNGISAHYFELTPTALTALGSGQVLYKAPETTAGGSSAIDFEKSTVVGENETVLTVPVSSIQAGTYEYLRVSLAYQNYDITLRYNDLDITGTLASFIGFNTYLKDYKIKSQTVNVNSNKLQGYWGFETIYNVTQGDAARTTVPNPISATSPVPAGSCVVTAAFDTPLTITGNETQDIVITISLSTNKSFEWKDDNSNGLWEPALSENVVDMGIRGMKLIVN